MMNNQGCSTTPYKLRILVTNECPAKCVGCHNEFQSDGVSRDKFVSVSKVEELLLSLNRLNRLPYEVVLSGGEPSLFKQLDELARIVRSLGVPYISLNSNCVGWSSVVSTLMWIDEVKVHIEDLPYTGNKNAYVDSIGLGNKVLEDIKTLPSLLRKEQCAYVNSIMRSKEQTQRVIEFCKEFGFNTKLIEESLITTSNVSYSLDACLDYLLQQGYEDTTLSSGSRSSCVMTSQDGLHSVYLRRCISHVEPFVSFDNTGLVTVKFIELPAITQVYEVKDFPYSGIFKP